MAARGELGMAKNKKIVSLNGPPCPRCGCPTEIREHERITETELARPFYYRRWYNCRNRDCKTTTIMPDEFKVRNGNDARHLHDVVPTTERRDSTEWRPAVSLPITLHRPQSIPMLSS